MIFVEVLCHFPLPCEPHGEVLQPKTLPAAGAGPGKCRELPSWEDARYLSPTGWNRVGSREPFAGKCGANALSAELQRCLDISASWQVDAVILCAAYDRG